MATALLVFPSAIAPKDVIEFLIFWLHPAIKKIPIINAHRFNFIAFILKNYFVDPLTIYKINFFFNALN